MANFTYRPRSSESWDKRANQSGGDYEGFVKDEYLTYRPKKGDNCIRILPPTYDGADHYGIDIYVHYSVGPSKAQVLCLERMKGKPCPICEARNRALKIGDEELAGELKSGKRVVAWVLDRNDEDRGPMIWAMPYTLDRDFAGLAKDKQTGEIYPLDHPDNGYDIFFDRTGEGKLVQYGGKQLARRTSPVAEKFLDYIEERPLPGALIWRDYAEVKRLYEGSGGSDEAPAPATPPVPRRPNGSGNGAAEPVRRRVASDAPASATRRVAPPEAHDEYAPSRTRREEINEETPFDEKPEPEPQPEGTVERLRQRYTRG